MLQFFWQVTQQVQQNIKQSHISKIISKVEDGFNHTSKISDVKIF